MYSVTLKRALCELELFTIDRTQFKSQIKIGWGSLDNGLF
jgi:hypothetical protein